MLREIALLLSTSLFFAMGFAWLGYPYLLGYIATGVFLGPFVRLIESPVVISILGSFGMLMLLFIVGLEFDLVNFRKIWKKALFIVTLQIIVNFALAMLFKYFFNLSFIYSVLIAFLLTLSSTAVVVKLLEEMNQLNTKNGQLVISILIMQDLAFVPMTMILRALSENLAFKSIALNLILAVGLLFVLILYLGKESNKFLSPLRNLFNGNQEIMTLASATVCFSFAAIASALGLSSAYGAFIGGLILGSFGNKLEIMQFALPIGSMLIMMFFISIGSQIDLQFIKGNWKQLTLISCALLFVKIFVNYFIMRFMNISWKNSLFSSVMLSQASEFSFAFIAILSSSSILSVHDESLLNAIVVISLTIGSVFPVVANSLYHRVNKLI